MEIPVLWVRVQFQNFLQTDVKLGYSEISIGVEILCIFHAGILETLSFNRINTF